MFNTVSKFAMAAILAGFLTAPLYAHTGNLKVDSGHSDARFSIDGTLNKTHGTFTIGAARVVGTVNLDKDDPAKSTVAFSLYPATSNSPAIDPDGKPAANSGLELTNYTLVSFQAERVSLTSDGKLRAAGALSLIRIDRNADYAPNEAYAGPVYYGPPIIQRVVREASFVIALLDPASGESERNARVEGTATAEITQEEFPELVQAVLDSNWPAVVQDENCTTPTTIGEDYAGTQCAGDEVQVASFPVVYSGSGEDYSGFHAAPVQLGNNLTILVHMQLTREPSEPTAKAAGRIDPKRNVK